MYTQPLATTVAKLSVMAAQNLVSWAER